MSNSGEFFLAFLSPFFKGFVGIFKGIYLGLLQMFNVIDYINIVKKYSSKMGGAKVFIVALAIICLLALTAVLIFLIIRVVKLLIRGRKRKHERELLMEEVENLNYDNIRLKQENEKYLAMANDEDKKDGTADKDKSSFGRRFFRLSKIDDDWASYVPETFNNTIQLNQICEQFRNYAANKLGLYYDINLIRLFISAFSSNRLIILQGISGTGKTSLAYAFGSFMGNESVIAPVQPSWRDRAELFGYFNEFTKRFNETELLSKMYEAQYNDKIYVSILDEMNIARVEYYFAEMLSIMEMPNYTEWVIDLVSNPWPTDPIKLVDGKFQIPKNMWYIGTINNDDSTFMVTDKVYDRALPIDINEKAPKFDAPLTEKLSISSEYLMSLYDMAEHKYPLTEGTVSKIDEMDKYIISHFKISFGNRILQQMREFIPAFVACGGTEIVAVDYLICHKILRKFEQLNPSYIRNEIDNFIVFLNQLFGEGNMKECVNFLMSLKNNV